MHDLPMTQAKYEEIWRPLTVRLENIVAKKDGLKVLFQLQGNDAQRALDLLKTFLAQPWLPVSLRGDIVVAMQRMAKKRNLLPQALVGVKIVDNFPQHKGGFAEVYRGKFQGRVVCVKKLARTMRNARNRLMQLCAREAILWGSLNHPNIHKFMGVCELDSELCLISPWASSGTIMEYLQKHPKANRLIFAVDMAEGLKYLHSLRIIHGDIKSANVLIRMPRGPRAVLADFGISSLSGEGIVDLTSFSDVCSIGGTVRWQAPELLEATATTGRIPNTRESDIWALACTFYEIFTGKLPYFGVAPLDIKDHVVRQGQRPQRPDKASPAWQQYGLNRWIWLLFQKCWRTEPKDRPSIERILRILDGWIPQDVWMARQQTRRCLSAPVEMIEVFNQLKPLRTLEKLLASVGSTNGEPTEPATPEDDRRVRCRCGRKHPRSLSNSDKEDRAPKRVKLSHEIRLQSDLAVFQELNLVIQQPRLVVRVAAMA